jgi:superfamily I DNA/RNA helicase
VASPTKEQLEEIEQRRKKAVDAILSSASSKKLVVAGPGTGKSFTFRRALEAAAKEGKRGLALTFIRNLVVDLAKDLGDIADVHTFHGFCKRLMHKNTMEGLSARWSYFPPLYELLEVDLVAALGVKADKELIETRLHNLDREGGILASVLRLGSYYDAVSHTDLVYRVLQHFRENDDRLPCYSLVVVDEYQDFSLLETSFIGLLATKNPVLVAGDDDQALYGFKGASPWFIRELASDESYESFELPYCSRCTGVVVSEVNDVVAAAVANGNLANRLEKEFACYLPSKLKESDQYPRIIHAACSVERSNAPYVGRYVLQQIAAIPAHEIAESKKGGYPTVLIVGPRPFLTSAFQVVREKYPHAVLKVGQKLTVDDLEGYRRLAADPKSRLGWRIILHAHPIAELFDVLRAVHTEGKELSELLPDSYRTSHLNIAALVKAATTGEISEDGVEILCMIFEKSAAEIAEALQLDGDQAEEKDQEESDLEDVPENEPTILCTTMLGSKGLSAAHVYIVGFNNLHMPRDPKKITDEEICQFLVALSRTRKLCHVVSCGRLGQERREVSEFAKWIGNHLEWLEVNADYFKR